MVKTLPKRKMYRYCLADIAKGLFNGMIGNYLLYFFQPTVKSGLPQLLPQDKLLGYITIMALITALGKVVELATFDYFNINLLLSYIVRLGLVHRWAQLDGERGLEMFRRLVGSLGASEQIRAAERRFSEE